MVEPRWLCLPIAMFLLSAALPATEDRDLLEQEMTLNLVDARAKDVFGSFASILNGQVDLDPAVSGKLTIGLRGVSLGTVLTALCEMLDCEWKLTPGVGKEGPTLTVRPLEGPHEKPPEIGTLATPITINLTQAPPRQVFSAFATILGADLDLEWPKTVTIDFREVPLGRALDETCAQVGCSWQLSEDEEARKLRVWKEAAVN